MISRTRSSRSRLAELRLEDGQRLGDDVADRHARIERGDRILEDDLHVAARGAHLLVGKIEKIAALPQDAAFLRFQQPQDGAAERGLAAAGFADDAERAAFA